MNLSNLETFLAIVETGQLNRAAERLNVTQSTVHARLNQLEQSLGQPLFHRRKSGAEKTPAGFRFERYAQLMTELWKQAQQETALPADVESVGIFGCHVDLWPVRGAAIFDQMRTLSPNMAASAWPGEEVTLDRWMSTSMVDVALTYSATLDDSWQVHQLPGERLVEVSTRPRERVRWDPGYIYVDLGEGFRKDHAAAYADGDRPMITIASPLWALEYLLQHGGSAYLPEALVQPHIGEGTLFLVPDTPVFIRPVYLLVSRQREERWQWFAGLLKTLQST